jgi:hypothetical protein
VGVWGFFALSGVLDLDGFCFFDWLLDSCSFITAASRSRSSSSLVFRLPRSNAGISSTSNMSSYSDSECSSGPAWWRCALARFGWLRFRGAGGAFRLGKPCFSDFSVIGDGSISASEGGAIELWRGGKEANVAWVLVRLGSMLTSFGAACADLSIIRGFGVISPPMRLLSNVSLEGSTLCFLSIVTGGSTCCCNR